MEPSDTLVAKLPVHNANTRGSRRKTKHEKLKFVSELRESTKALSAPQTDLDVERC
jgi:hypothetical protein